MSSRKTSHTDFQIQQKQTKMILPFRKIQMYVVWQLFMFCSIFHLIPFSVLCLSGCRALKRQIDNVESSIAATVQEGSCRELWQSHVGAYPDSINLFSMFSALIPYFQNEFFYHNSIVCFDCFNRMLKKQNESTHLVIPTSDMMRFREKIGAKISGLLAKTTHNYAKMKQIVIADLVSFNKKPDREVSGVTPKNMILQRSLALQRAQTTDYDIFKLTEVEMMFAKYYTLLRLPGKGGKFVPVLIPPKTLEVIDIMIIDDKLKSDNYFFQTEGGEQFYRSIDVLRKYAEEFKMQDKKVFRSTKLRKYLTTAAQFLDLPQNQRVWVADLLEHDLNVHDKYYRMHTDAVNLAKMTKLLYIADKGKVKDAYLENLDTLQPTLNLVDSVTISTNLTSNTIANRLISLNSNFIFFSIILKASVEIATPGVWEYFSLRIELTIKKVSEFSFLNSLLN